jgi:hypothetical protein
MRRSFLTLLLVGVGACASHQSIAKLQPTTLTATPALREAFRTVEQCVGRKSLVSFDQLVFHMVPATSFRGYNHSVVVGFSKYDGGIWVAEPGRAWVFMHEMAHVMYQVGGITNDDHPAWFTRCHLMPIQQPENAIALARE